METHLDPAMYASEAMDEQSPLGLLGLSCLRASARLSYFVATTAGLLGKITYIRTTNNPPHASAPTISRRRHAHLLHVTESSTISLTAQIEAACSNSRKLWQLLFSGFLSANPLDDAAVYHIPRLLPKALTRNRSKRRSSWLR